MAARGRATTGVTIPKRNVSPIAALPWLQINFRGSTGYGKAFLHAGDRQWGGKMLNDLIDGVNWIVGEGVADKNRVGIYGGSYGG